LWSLVVFPDENDLEIDNDNDVSRRSVAAEGLDSEERLIRFAL
jgi:hypothetical protein